jgi:ubiquinone/menaquinone biosynthesis C-methylase UbiE
MEESSFLNPAYVLANAKVHEGQNVADFGAQGGFFTRAAARAVGPEGTVWAVDTNGELLSRIKSLSIAEGLHNVEILRGNIESAKGSGLPAEHFDAVVAANILFSAEHKHKLIAEMHRVLKRTGRGLVIDWSSSHGGLGPHPDHVVTEAAARTLFEEGGFTYLESIPAGAYHWGFIVRKKAAKEAQ